MPKRPSSEKRTVPASEKSKTLADDPNSRTVAVMREAAQVGDTADKITRAPKSRTKAP